MDTGIEKKSVEIFCCYAREDRSLLLKLRTHLASLEREGTLNIWYDMDITPGTEWQEEISKRLNNAHIILLLISPAFMASEYCYSKEMKQAMERHERGEARVIPILLRPSIWQEAPFARLQVLPNNARAVSEWRNRDQAWFTITQGIKHVVNDQLTNLSLQQPPNTTKDTRLHPKSIDGIVRLDWGEAPDVPVFFGRTKELLSLEQWLTSDHCRLVAIVGMKGIGKTKLSLKLGRGGIGKTDLSLEIARGIQDRFDYVIWRRLLNAPKVSEILTDLIKFLSHQQEVQLPNTVSEQIARLLHYLRESRCLVILDNVEMILQGGQYIDQYSPGYEEYGQLFEQIAEIPHQSCLLLTSREKPPEIVRLESKTGPVRSLELRGLSVADGKKIFTEIGSFAGSKEDWKQLNYLYNGNPLALELAARHIKEVFFGSISAFLREGKPIFADLRSLLDWHFNRLSDSHKEAMYWFAINREPTSLSELKEDLLSPLGKEQVASTLYSLQRLIPLEKSTDGFTLQPVLLEYMTQRLVEQIVEEVRTGEMYLFNTHALLKTSVSDYVRDIQSRLILQSVSEKLLEIYRNQIRLEGRLKELLSLLRESFRSTSGYAGGNMLNLLCSLKVDLSGYNFSSLSVWQAYLRGKVLSDINFRGAHFVKSVFSDTFDSITCVNFSPNGQQLVAGTRTGELRVWDVASSMLVLTCRRHTDWVKSVAFSPDGHIIASGSDDQTVRLWDIHTGQCLAILRGHSHALWAVAFSLDGHLVASSGADQTVRLWEVKSGQCLATLQGHTGWVYSIAFSPDGQVLASGSADQTIRLWDSSTTQCLTILPTHSGEVASIAFSPDGHILASGSADQTIRLWDSSTGQSLAIFQGHRNWVRGVAFSPDGLLLASESRDQTIRLWDISTAQCITVLPSHSGEVASIAFSPDGHILASSSIEQTVRFWKVSNGQSLTTLQGYTNCVYSVAISPDGHLVVSGSDDKTVRLWEVNTGRCQATLQGHTSGVYSVAFSPDGHLVASGSDDKTVRLWEVNTGQCLTILRSHSHLVIAVAFSPDGSVLASGSHDRTIRLWEVSSGQCLATLQGHTNWLYSVAFSPNGCLVASGSADETVRLWEVGTNKSLGILRGHTNMVYSVAFSPDGRLVASGSDDQTVQIWEVNTCKHLSILQGHDGQVSCVAFSPDGRLLASGGHDETIRLWEVDSGKCLVTLRGHTSWVFSVAFNLEGTILASSSTDGTIRLWEVSTGDTLRILKGDRPYERMVITGVTGLTDAQKATLRALGAVETDKQELIEGQLWPS